MLKELINKDQTITQLRRLASPPPVTVTKSALTLADIMGQLRPLQPIRR